MGTHDHDDCTPRDSEPEPAMDDMSLALIEEQADRTIRRVWYNGRMYFSVVDVIAMLTDSTAPGQYWRDMKRRMRDDEGWSQTQANCLTLRLRAADGKMRLADCANAETLLRIVQSIPSPKAEPIKQWLARTGAQRLDEVARPLDVADAGIERAAIAKPPLDAPALAWAEYHEQLAVLYRRQAAYETRIEYVEARLDEHEEQIGGLHSRMESLEEGQRMLPELLLRLGPQTLTPEHQATAKAMVKRLHDLASFGFGAIYGELNEAFHVGKFSDIPDVRWEEVVAWLTVRIKAAEKHGR